MFLHRLYLFPIFSKTSLNKKFEHFMAQLAEAAQVSTSSSSSEKQVCGTVELCLAVVMVSLSTCIGKGIH